MSDYIPDPPNPADDEDFADRMAELDRQAELNDDQESED